MHRLAIVLVVWLVACKGKPDERSATRGAEPTTLAVTAGDTQPGAAIQPDELRVAPELAVGYGVIVPAGADLGKLAAAAKAAKLTEVIAKPIGEMQLDRGALTLLAGDALTPADIDGILGSAGVVVLLHVGADARATFDKAATVTADLADRVNGWVMDPEAQRFQSAAAFRASLPAPGKPVDVRTQIIVRTVQGEGELPFLLTAGMGKFGLPELYVRTLPRARAADVTLLINATAQALATGTKLARPGELQVDLARLGEGWPAAEAVKAGGSAKITWKVAWVQEPDGHERAIELIPAGGATTEAVEAMLGAAFGDRDDPIHEFAADDPEMLAAYARARTVLGAQRKHFANGVPTNELLLVKAPFAFGDGGADNVEWMWVGVVRWHGETLEGTLDNDPIHVTDLKAGAAVKVQLGQIADFMHTRADGSTTGGYTIEIARKRGLIND